MAFQRHCAENGQPTWVLSDRAAEYLKAKDAIEEIIHSDAVRKYMENKGIKWKLSPARSPQHNSTAESLIKVSKSALYGIFGTKKLTETEFSTAIKLAQNTMNSIPLTAVSDDPKDENLLTITPHHLKLGRPVAMLPASTDEMNEGDLKKLKISIHDRWTKRKLIQQNFYLRWQNEYLSSLSQNKRAENKEIKEGDVILLLNERHSRDEWPLARITKLFRSQDGVVRSVECKVAHSSKTKRVTKKNAPNQDNNELYIQTKPRITTRGVEHIAILEGAPCDSTQSLQDVEAGHTSSPILDDPESSSLDD